MIRKRLAFFESCIVFGLAIDWNTRAALKNILMVNMITLFQFLFGSYRSVHLVELVVVVLTMKPTFVRIYTKTTAAIIVALALFWTFIVCYAGSRPFISCRQAHVSINIYLARLLFFITIGQA